MPGALRACWSKSFRRLSSNLCREARNDYQRRSMFSRAGSRQLRTSLTISSTRQFSLSSKLRSESTSKHWSRRPRTSCTSSNNKRARFSRLAIRWRDEFNALVASRGLPLQIQAIHPEDRFDGDRMVCAEGSSNSRLAVKEPLSWVIMDRSNPERPKVLHHGLVLTA